MKKIAVLLLVSMVWLCGCSAVNDVVNQVADSVTAKMSDEDMYSELSRLIGYPDGLSRTDLDGKFTFIAMVMDEGEEIFFEDENYTGYFYAAYISRNWDDFFYLETTDLEVEFVSGDIVKVTGVLDGSIYWTEDNKQVEVISIKASAIEAYTPAEIEQSNESSITMPDGNTIEFVGAHATEDSFGRAIAVYFKYTNNGSTDSAPTLRDFYVEYGGEEASSTIFGLDEVDSSALELGVGITDKTFAGKSQLYYIAYEGEAQDDDNAICFSQYDDEFRCTYDYDLVVADSLAALKG